MQLRIGNLWTYHLNGCWICITTNGIVARDGGLVMGKGLALEAANRFPTLRFTLGNSVRQNGNVLVLCPQERIISFPTKHHWRQDSDLVLIKQSVQTLVTSRPVIQQFDELFHRSSLPVCLPKVGCGNGGLNWNTQVCPLLSDLLDDNYIVVYE